MSISTEMYFDQYTRQSRGPSQLVPNLHYHPNSLPNGLHTLSDPLYCHRPFNSYSNVSQVMDIWASNFVEGMRLVRRLAKKASYVAVDTEFPGVVAKVFGDYVNTFAQAYHNIKVNIDILRPIQIGFSFFGEQGHYVDLVSTVQFNLKWNLDNETHATDSIQLLQDCGIDFFKLKRDGIELLDFAEAFLASGVALNDEVTWIGFHSAYDFAYMMKLCTDWHQMPEDASEFQRLLSIFFPRIVDLKSIMSEHKFVKGGLQELADALRVPRIGNRHQAGSDSMLTGDTFFRFLEKHTDGKLNPRVVNLVYGFNYSPNGSINSFVSASEAGTEQNGAVSYVTNAANSEWNRTHSANQSGRNSPEGSMSGHKSS